MVDTEKEKKLIKQIQKCQRNWDYSKTIPQAHIDYLLWVAKNAPSKQHEAYYDIYYSHDRKTIKELYNWTWGNTYGGEFNNKPPSAWRNSQMNANFFMLFVIKHPPTFNNSMVDGSTVKGGHPPRWDNGLVAVGTALGLTMRAAAELGYYTGCNKNNSNGPDCDFYWEKKLGIYEDVHVHKTKQMLYGLGIGFPQEGKPRNESDDYELVIGAANGHNLSLEDKGEERDIRGWKYRQVKMVDIRYSDKAVDPYGNVHELPEKNLAHLNSHHFRDIKVIEIK
jgi:nitroreductase|tara:strand:+ start:1932 stop:2771 length:840 start_codon:yes stop_codon:yes gene_type:complete